MFLYLYFWGIIFGCFSCKKFVEVPVPQEQGLGRLIRAGQLMHLFLSLCALTHTLNPFSLKISVPTLELPENAWCSTHKRLGFRSFTGACGWYLLKVAHRDHKDRVLTLLWQNSGALCVCHHPVSDLPHSTERVTTASLRRTDPAWDCSWPHRGTVRAGS